MIKELTCPESEEVFQMFRDIPEQEEGFGNPFFGLGRKEFDSKCREIIESKNNPADREPQTILIFYSNGAPVGFTKIRRYLDENYSKIAFGIRPGQRGKGFGNAILQHSLQYAGKMGIDRLFATIDSRNTASKKTIEKNGGIFESEETYWWGTQQRFWIQCKI